MINPRDCYKLYQTANFTDFGYHKDPFRLIVPPRPTALVKADSLNEVFVKTQHREVPWYGNRNEDVILPIRSTSVGDVIVSPDFKVFVVDSAGFTEFPGYTWEKFPGNPVNQQI